MTGFKETWTDTVRRVHAHLAETEVIRYTRPEGTTIWVTSVILDIAEPGNDVCRLTVYGMTEDGVCVEDRFLDGADDYPGEICLLIPELVSVGEKAEPGPDEVMLSTGAVARALGVSAVEVARWDKTGVLKPAFCTPGGHRRYRASDIIRLGGDPVVVMSPRKPAREDVSTREIARLRDSVNLSWKQIGAIFRMSAEGARKRYVNAHSGEPRPARAEGGTGGP